MDSLNRISYIRRLICYFKSKEITPAKEEEDRVWNDIMSEIRPLREKPFIPYKWQASTIISLGAAAILAGVIFILDVNKGDEPETLHAVYRSMDCKKADYGKKEIRILAEDKVMAVAGDNVVIDYSKSEKEVTVGEKKIGKPRGAKYHQLLVPSGSRTCLVLADGSMLHVNAGTRVVYPERFKENRREIFVDGEIYIDVRKNAKAPFVVNTTSCSIEVLGTSFNVNAYSSDTGAEIVLVNGSVKLKDKHDEEIVLRPDELAVLDGSAIKGKYQVDVSCYTSWINGLLKLDSTPLSSVFKSLERYYGITINYSEEAGRLKMYGNLDLECPIEEILRRIRYTAPISYTNEDDKFEIIKVNR